MRYLNLSCLIFFSLTISLNFSCTKDEDIFSQALDENIQEELEQSKEETETESSGEQNEENDFPGQEDVSINAKVCLYGFRYLELCVQK